MPFRSASFAGAVGKTARSAFILTPASLPFLALLLALLPWSSCPRGSFPEGVFTGASLHAQDAPAGGAADPRSAAPLDPSLRIEEAQLRRHVAFLASDDLGGRDSGEPGLEVAAERIASELAKLGLEPGGDNGTYFHHFSVPLGARFTRIEGVEVTLGAGPPILWGAGADVEPFGYGNPGATVADGPLAFVGYGITTNDEERQKGLVYDDYAGLDVHGRVVIVLRYTPRWKDESSPFGGTRSPHAPFVAKLRNAAEHGAAGVIFATPPEPTPDGAGAGGGDGGGAAAANAEIYGIRHRASPRPPILPAVVVSTDALSLLLARSGKDFPAIVREIDESGQPRSFELPGAHARFETVANRAVLRNVVARLPGVEGPLGEESIVVGAHYDHIGRFGNQVSQKNLGEIHNGADDNASGTAGVLELARVLSRGGRSPGRAVVFALFSGEELGLFGSRAWVNDPRPLRVTSPVALAESTESSTTASSIVSVSPTVPSPSPSPSPSPIASSPSARSPSGAATIAPGTILELAEEWTATSVRVREGATGQKGWVPSTAVREVGPPVSPHRTVAMINLDMIGHQKADAPIIALGVDSSEAFAGLLQAAAEENGLPAPQSHRGPAVGGSDHESFLRKGIPVLYFFTGMHKLYNTPGDDTETLEYEGMRKLLELARSVATRLLTAPRPDFKAPAKQAPAGHGRPRLGVEIAEAEDGTAGVRVRSVAPESPAAKGGVREGDLIVRLGERTITSPESLLEALDSLSAGEEETPLVVARGGEELTLGIAFERQRGGFRVAFGSVPDYAFEGRGVRFDAIREKTSAAKAGVLAGDILVRWGETPVEDVEQWTALLGAHKPGDEVAIQVLRGQETVALKVVLEARE